MLVISFIIFIFVCLCFACPHPTQIKGGDEEAEADSAIAEAEQADGGAHAQASLVEQLRREREQMTVAERTSWVVMRRLLAKIRSKAGEVQYCRVWGRAFDMTLPSHDGEKPQRFPLSLQQFAS
jgi:hypothetical protein